MFDSGSRVVLDYYAGFGFFITKFKDNPKGKIMARNSFVQNFPCENNQEEVIKVFRELEKSGVEFEYGDSYCRSQAAEWVMKNFIEESYDVLDDSDDDDISFLF